MGRPVCNVRTEQSRQAHYSSNPADTFAGWTFLSRPRGRCWPILSRFGLQVHSDDGRPHYAVARGHAHIRHNGGDNPADVPVDLCCQIWGASYSNIGQRGTVHLSGVAGSTRQAGHEGLYHPQANGIVEWFYRMLKDALRCTVRYSKSWARSLPFVLLGIYNAPKLDTATSTAEVIFGVPLRVPRACFPGDREHQSSAKEQLDLARSNAAAFTPEALDVRKFKTSPFVAKTLRTAKFVYVLDDRLGKASLAPRYSGPYKVLDKNWEKNTFKLEGRKIACHWQG